MFSAIVCLDRILSFPFMKIFPSIAYRATLGIVFVFHGIFVLYTGKIIVKNPGGEGREIISADNWIFGGFMLLLGIYVIFRTWLFKNAIDGKIFDRDVEIKKQILYNKLGGKNF